MCRMIFDSIDRALLTSETDNTVYRESSNVLESNVAGDDGDRVNDSVAVLSIVRGVGGEVSETDASGEEDLTTRSLPDLTVGKLGASPRSPEVFDAFARVIEGKRSTDEDDGYDNRKAHGPVNNSASETDTSEDADPDEEPGEAHPTGRLSEHCCARELNITGVVAVLSGCYRILVCYHIFHEVVGRVTGPGQR